MKRRSAWQVQRAVLFALVLREMKARVNGQWIGAVWTVFEPLANILLVLLITGLLRAPMVGSFEYPVFLMSGLIPYFFFQKLVTRLLDGFDANRGLFAYRQVKPLDTLLSRAFVEGLFNVVVYGVTLLAVGWVGYHVIPDSLLGVLGVNLLTGALGFSLGLMLAVLSDDRPRLRSMIRLTFFPLYFASGVMFNVDALPRKVIDGLLWNPVLHIVELSRHAFNASYIPTDGINAWYPMAWTLVSLTLGLSLYQVKRLSLLTIR
jgi:capsular polysaccharide transport system permease protein